MPSSSTPTPSAPAYVDSSSEAEASDYGRPTQTPAPVKKSVPPSTATVKSPNVFKTPPSSSPTRKEGIEANKREALVKPSTKKVDTTRGKYAPVMAPDEPRSSSELSDFSDPDLERQDGRLPPPRPASSRSRRQSTVEPASESDKEQEEEEESRPPQTRQEKRKRMWWIVIGGGALIIAVIVIVVVIMLLNSGKKDASATGSHALNSTEHASSANMTSHNSTVGDSHSSVNSSSTSLADGDAAYRTTLPTKGITYGVSTASGDLDEIDSLIDSSGTTAAKSLGNATATSNSSRTVDDLAPITDMPSPTPTPSITDMSSLDPSRDEREGTDSQVGSQEIESSAHSYGAIAPEGSGSTDFDRHHTHIESSDGNASQKGLSPAPTQQPSSDASPAQGAGSKEDLEHGGSVVVDPLLPGSANGEEASSVVLPTPIDSDGTIHATVAPITLTPIEAPASSDPRLIPTEWLRPLPQASQPGSGSGHGQGTNQDAQPKGSAWWPVPTPGSQPSSTSSSAQGESEKRVKWVGKATWFAPGDTLESCQTHHNDSDFVVALSKEIYGASTSISTFCGAKIHVWNEFTNQTRTGSVVGVCEDCKGPTDINLSQSLFSELDNPDIGVLDVQWWFDDSEMSKQTTADLSEYESTARHDEPEKFETTAIFWKKTGWKSKCGPDVKDDSLYIGLPLALWSDPSQVSSEYCGKKVKVKNLAGDQTIEVEVVEPSNREDYATFTKKAFEQLGGDPDAGELAVEFWFS